MTTKQYGCLGVSIINAASILPWALDTYIEWESWNDQDRSTSCPPRLHPSSEYCKRVEERECIHDHVIPISRIVVNKNKIRSYLEFPLVKIQTNSLAKRACHILKEPDIRTTMTCFNK